MEYEYKEMNNDMNKIDVMPIDKCEEKLSTISENLKTTTDILYEIEANIDNMIDFIWSNGSKRDQVDIEITSMDTNIVNNMIVSERILKKLKDMYIRLGC